LERNARSKYYRKIWNILWNTSWRTRKDSFELRCRSHTRQYNLFGRRQAILIQFSSIARIYAFISGNLLAMKMQIHQTFALDGPMHWELPLMMVGMFVLISKISQIFAKDDYLGETD
jgi:hypothetical protein